MVLSSSFGVATEGGAFAGELIQSMAAEVQEELQGFLVEHDAAMVDDFNKWLVEHGAKMVADFNAFLARRELTQTVERQSEVAPIVKDTQPEL